jgi:hypothetical protein
MVLRIDLGNSLTVFLHCDSVNTPARQKGKIAEAALGQGKKGPAYPAPIKRSSVFHGGGEPVGFAGTIIVPAVAHLDAAPRQDCILKRKRGQPLPQRNETARRPWNFLPLRTVSSALPGVPNDNLFYYYTLFFASPPVFIPSRWLGERTGVPEQSAEFLE